MEFSDLLGKTLIKVEKIGNQELVFHTTEGERYKLYHDQDCCESVIIDDVVGDLEDLVGNPILKAEEVSNYRPITEEDVRREEESESCTWTFYKLATKKGYVDIRWFGESNGYYSEGVDFIKAEKDKEFNRY